MRNENISLDQANPFLPHNYVLQEKVKTTSYQLNENGKLY